jgi:hypothetical protein
VHGKFRAVLARECLPFSNPKDGCCNWFILALVEEQREGPENGVS